MSTPIAIRLQYESFCVTLRLLNPKGQKVHQKPSENAKQSSCILYVCTSCRTAGTPREPRAGRQGAVLYQKIRKAFENVRFKSQVDVKPAECLSICPRPCGLALTSPGAWTYLFGDQHPNLTVQEIVECVSLYLEAENGFMPRAQRPKSLQKGILGRIPPRQESGHASS